MKFNVLLAFIFAIVTSFTALHELEHIGHDHYDDKSECLIFHMSGLETVDLFPQPVITTLFHFDKIQSENLAVKLYYKEKNNQNRAPPSLS